MKRLPSILLLICIVHACAGPKNFSYYYNGENTGLDQMIDIDGYYVSEHGCDSLFCSMYMFYPDGLFIIATTSKIHPELIDCYRGEGLDKNCKYPLWGTYTIEGDLIKTQTIRTEGNGCVYFRDYQMLPDKSIVNVSDYVEAEYTNLAYMTNYPSFMENLCEKRAQFYPLDKKRDSKECPFLKKKWFRGK